jgi:hypothetical protein
MFAGKRINFETKSQFFSPISPEKIFEQEQHFTHRPVVKRSLKIVNG